MKTITVLMVGWLYFGDVMTSRKGMGILMAVAGMIGYGYFISRPQPTAPAAAADKLDRMESGDVKAALLK